MGYEGMGWWVAVVQGHWQARIRIPFGRAYKIDLVVAQAKYLPTAGSH